MENHLLATLSQQQVLSQEQQQSLRILQMPTQELLGEIELMLESNPLLEVEEPAQASDDPQRALRSMTTTGGTTAARMIPNSTQPRRRRPSTSPTRPGRAPPATKRPSSAFPPPNPSGTSCSPISAACRSRRASICSSPALSRSSTTGASSRPRSRRSCATTRASSRRKASRT